MKNSTTIYMLVFILLVSLVQITAQTATEIFDQTLTEIYENNPITGFAVTVVNKDKILYQNAKGYSDIDKKKPYTAHTLQNIGSISKTFIGVALMQLETAGKLTMDTEVNDILPFKVVNPHYPNTPITIRHLATHTGTIKDRQAIYDFGAYVSTVATKERRKGLPSFYRKQFKHMYENKQMSIAQYLENVLVKTGTAYDAKNFLEAAPGTVENYSNIGATLAAYIIEVVTGENYGRYVQQNILEPLGMQASSWTKETVDPTELAKLYIKGKVIPDYHLITYPDGGLISSTAELTTYLMAMMKGYYGENDFLTTSSFQALMSDHLTGAGLENPHWGGPMKSGLFWEYIDTDGKDNIGHSGSDPGILTLLFFDPEIGIGYVATFNCVDGQYSTGIRKVWDLLSKQKQRFKDDVPKIKFVGDEDK